MGENDNYNNNTITYLRHCAAVWSSKTVDNATLGDDVDDDGDDGDDDDGLSLCTADNKTLLNGCRYLNNIIYRKFMQV